MSSPRTLMEFLQAARGYLAGKGVDNPRGDADQLLSKALGISRLQLYLQHDRLLAADEVARFRELLSRRGRREPLQLILGAVEFCAVRIVVNPGLLIPRPETEGLVAEVIRLVDAHAGDTVRILDVGTGTGCIAVALAASMAHALVDAVDIDFEAVRCASANASLNVVADRVRVLRSDVLCDDFLQTVIPPYDIVVSNPPYVAEPDYTLLEPEVRQYESRQALVGGHDGLLYYQRLADLLPALLRPGGCLVVEVGHDQAGPVQRLFAGILGSVGVIPDLAGVPRVVSGVLRLEEEPSRITAS